MVIGLGYVGLVAVAGLAKAGYQITGVDINIKKINSLNNGKIDIYEPGLKEVIDEARLNQRISFKNIAEIKNIDCGIVIICVGTPSRPDGAADLSQVEYTIEWIKERTINSLTIIMKSTVPPGTGELLYKKYLAGFSYKINYISNPEFLREGQALKDWFYPDRIVIGGNNNKAIEEVSALYDSLNARIVKLDITSAELIKYAANAFLATKISFINEIACLCDCLGADINSVATGIGLDNRIGEGFLKAGIGYGGSCFPKDVRALNFLSTINGHNFELLRATIIVNSRQRLLPVQKLRSYLGNLVNKNIAVLGLTFKPGTDDIRESPSLDIIRLLLDEGANVSIYDPIRKNLNINLFRKDQIRFGKNILDTVKGTEAVVVATEWDQFIDTNWSEIKIVMNEPFLIVDGRNCLDPCIINNCGFIYSGIGRAKAHER
ncbi:UDP-glucose dehydrogenase family protein [Desulfocucumis palustris]|nr:UDP-glucose/GDP-mannose dehydrogenase family protein [Desulfocucumis palustris]